MSCWICGDGTSSAHSPAGCLSNLRARIERLEECIHDPDFDVKPAQPEPKAGQVWRSPRTGLLWMVTEGAGVVSLADGTLMDLSPTDSLFEFVCDGAVPASEVRP